MKNIIFFIFLVLIMADCIPQKGIFPGMPISTFRIAMPGRIPASLPFNETLQFASSVWSVDGTWEFGFLKNKLETISFSSPPDYLSWPLDTNTERYRMKKNENMNKYQHLIKQFTLQYGTPNRTESKTAGLEKNKASHTTDLEVREWDLKGMTMTARLRFLGDNPEILATNNSDVSMYAFVIEILFRKNELAEGKELVNGFDLSMNVYEFSARNPEILLGPYESGQPNYRETIYGLDGYWHYTFEKDTLDWYGYSFYINDAEELTEENFNRCLEAARKLIDEYTGYFGKPDELKEGKTEFIDPYQMRHWGYDVVEAKWIQDNLKCKVEFSFFGGKGQYFFQVLIKCFRPDYPYFD
ncbi:MAG: hypothetical protein ABIJ16_13280 [Bacteroidota bacterium]